MCNVYDSCTYTNYSQIKVKVPKEMISVSNTTTELPLL